MRCLLASANVCTSEGLITMVEKAVSSLQSIASTYFGSISSYAFEILICLQITIVSDFQRSISHGYAVQKRCVCRHSLFFTANITNHIIYFDHSVRIFRLQIVHSSSNFLLLKVLTSDVVLAIHETILATCKSSGNFCELRLICYSLSWHNPIFR